MRVDNTFIRAVSGVCCTRRSVLGKSARRECIGICTFRYIQNDGNNPKAGNLKFSKLLNCSRSTEDELKEMELGKKVGEEQEMRKTAPPSSSSMVVSMVDHVLAAGNRRAW
ncbi:hypothetical protein PUN28_014018 [Cardiocondyla obscurior]|uniref:Uncharacterized protein n=1 Tax=Cardiocondyla obscurior TaxID=286306 RepID=A0AAW2F691_9HYME